MNQLYLEILYKIIQNFKNINATTNKKKKKKVCQKNGSVFDTAIDVYFNYCFKKLLLEF